MATDENDYTQGDLISLARYGDLTPDEAEAKAAAKGWPPFAFEPPLPAFDPMKVSRWSIVMAVAWIAWRDIEFVRKLQSDFRSECTHWLFRHWREPIAGGTRFEKRAGWFLEPLSISTAASLPLWEAIRTRDESPAPMQMSVLDAEASLWQALGDGALVAAALDRDGKPVDIPQREWSYLKLFEVRGRDVLRYEPLDRQEPFSQVKLKRDDLLRLWPNVWPNHKADKLATWAIEEYMLTPISAEGNSGFVPLCTAMHWIMTHSCTCAVTMVDEEAWSEAVRQLWPLVCGGDIELIGLPLGESMTRRIHGESLTVVKLLSPLHRPIEDILLNARPHIACTAYVDQEHWDRDFNDMLYETGRSGPTWTHLQVRKSEILERWPRRVSTASVEQSCYRWLFQSMQSSPNQKPKSRDMFWIEAQEKFPTLARRQFIRVWQRAATDSRANWSNAGRPGKSNRSAS